jgi:ligand-binding sensor domain-containing protein
MRNYTDHVSSGRVLAIALALVLFAPAGRLSAQPVTPYFRHLTAEDGLSQQLVMSMLQDRQGYMWFGMLNGLHRYDGQRITTYRALPADSTSLPGNTVFSLYEDDHGTLWVGTDNGVVRYDREEDAFVQVAPGLRPFVSAIYLDRTGMLWLGTFDAGLYRLDPVTGDYTAYNTTETPASGYCVVNAIMEDRSGTVWLAAVTGLYELNTADGSLAARCWNRMASAHLWVPHTCTQLRESGRASASCIYRTESGRITGSCPRAGWSTRELLRRPTHSRRMGRTSG